MAPRFSVLMPTHDREDVVGLAIASVLAQTEPDFELLIVGDGCTDGTARVVEGFSDERVRWYDMPKAPGFGYANRNLALRGARGDLIAFAAHDDLLLPDHLTLLGERFGDPAVEWVYSRPIWVSDDGTMIPFAVDLTRRSQLDFFLDSANSIPASCVMHRRTCLERYGYWPEDVPSAGDWELWKAFLRPSLGRNLAYEPRGTTLHFRASWRGASLWGPAPLHRWLQVATGGEDWPHSLRASVAAGESPQAALWRAMQEEPSAWSRSVRRGVAEACDLLAWMQAAEIEGLHATAQAVGAEAGHWKRQAERSASEWAATSAALDRARHDLVAARVQVEVLMRSDSWRLTAPLRWIGARLRRLSRS